MATHAAFLRQTGVDARTIGVNSQRQIRVLDGALNPNAAFGKVYWVDKASGSDSSDGLSPEGAFLTIEYAVSISNAEVGSYNMNTIYVNSNTYAEDLTEEPKNVNIVGIGAKTRLQGTHTFDTGGNAAQNCHWWNMQFRDTSGVFFTITSNYYGLGWHGCTFENSGSGTGGISVALTHDLMIENCRFLGNPVFTTAIEITGQSIRAMLRDNIIGATTNGILVDSTTNGYGNFIMRNAICRRTADPNSASQMTYGLRFTNAGALDGFQCVDNRIAAVTPISFAHTAGTQSQDAAQGNRTGAAGTAAWNDA